MKNHHISEAGVSFEIQFGLWIKIWAGEHIFYIWQQTMALSNNYELRAGEQAHSIALKVMLWHLSFDVCRDGAP